MVKEHLCNTLNFKFLKMVKIMHSLKKLLGLHYMHNSFLSQRSNLFRRISIFLDFVFTLNFRIQFQNI
jgi:hypothetical protein